MTASKKNIKVSTASVSLISSHLTKFRDDKQQTKDSSSDECRAISLQRLEACIFNFLSLYAFGAVSLTVSVKNIYGYLQLYLNSNSNSNI